MGFGEQTGSARVARPENGSVSDHLLLREFSHRINNELSSAISLISLAAKRSQNSEVQATLAAVQDRLQGYASVHHSLQMPECSTTVELTSYLQKLCKALCRSKLESRKIELALSLCPVWITSERCWLLGMIVFELITNSARHAFLSGTGKIDLELFTTSDMIACRISDNGVAHPGAVPGRGLRIVAALVSRLHGTIDVKSGPQGTSSTVIFPMTYNAEACPAGADVGRILLG